MTPEQKKRFEDSINQLKLPEQPAPEPLAPQQETLEEVAEVNVELPKEFDDADPAPTAEVMDAFADGAGDTTTFDFDGMSAEQRKLQQQNEDAGFNPDDLADRPPGKIVRDEAAGVDVLVPETFDERYEQARASLPQTDEVWRERHRQAQLEREQFLNDDPKNVQLNPEDVDDLRADNNPNQAGEALADFLKAEQEWKDQVIRAFRENAKITRRKTADLREIIDAMLREHT